MNPFKLLSNDELVEMVGFPDKYFLGKDGLFHRISNEIP